MWQWLVQIGQQRAGFYSYRWLENLALAEMPKVERIVPEWQSRARGEVVWLGTPRHWHGNAKQNIAEIEAPSHYIMTGEADWQNIQAGGSAKRHVGLHHRAAGALEVAADRPQPVHDAASGLRAGALHHGALQCCCGSRSLRRQRQGAAGRSLLRRERAYIEVHAST